MELIVLGNRYHIEKGEYCLKMIRDKIEESLGHGQYVESHFVIDGIEVFNQNYEFISNNIESIHKLEVILKTKEEFSEEIIVSLNDYLTSALPQIKKHAESYHQINDNNVWESFIELIEALHWIVHSLEFLNNSFGTEKFPSQQLLQSSISNLLEAVKDTDMALIGDILEFEIIPYLMDVKEASDAARIECHAQ